MHNQTPLSRAIHLLLSGELGDIQLDHNQRYSLRLDFKLTCDDEVLVESNELYTVDDVICDPDNKSPKGNSDA